MLDVMFLNKCKEFTIDLCFCRFYVLQFFKKYTFIFTFAMRAMRLISLISSILLASSQIFTP